MSLVNVELARAVHAERERYVSQLIHHSPSEAREARAPLQRGDRKRWHHRPWKTPRSALRPG